MTHLAPMTRRNPGDVAMPAECICGRFSVACITAIIRRVSASTSVLALLVGGILIGAPAKAMAGRDPRSEEWWFTAWDIQNQVWHQSRGRGITVAVVDSGVNASLPELRNVVLPGTDARHGYQGDGRKEVKLGNMGPPEDPAGHGTGMAALIAGQGGPSGIVGIAPEAKILTIIADALPNNMSSGIVYAADHGAQVINISQGAVYPGGCPSDVQAAVLHAIDKGSVVVASMGNEGSTSNGVLFPASCAGVLGVGAVNNHKAAWTRTQRQSYVSAAAPGVEVGILTKSGTFNPNYSGTSQAAALSSGAVAMVRSKFPQLTPRQVVQRMINTTVDAGPPGPDNMTGAGVIVPIRALSVKVAASAPNPTFARLDTWRRENPDLARMFESPTPKPSATVSTTPSATPSVIAAGRSDSSSGVGSLAAFIVIVLLAVLVFTAAAIIMVVRRNASRRPMI